MQPPEELTCHVCGMALMRRGAALDMPHRQLTVDEEGRNFCPQCYEERDRPFTKEDRKALYDIFQRTWVRLTDDSTAADRVADQLVEWSAADMRTEVIAASEWIGREGSKT